MTPEDLINQPLYTLKTVYNKIQIMDRLLKYPTFAYYFFNYLLKPFVFKDYTRFNRGIRYSFMLLGGGRTSKGELLASSISNSEKKASLKRLLEAVESKKPIVWVEWSLSRIILHGFDVASLCPEKFVMIAFSIDKDIAYLFLDEANSQGILSEGCSSQKGAMGAILLNQIPKPSAIIATTLPCDSGISVYQNMQYHTNAPLFVLDAPYDRSQSSIKYYGEQFGEMIVFLERALNQSFNWDKLTKAVEEYNKYSHFISETSIMGKNIPCPYHITSLNDAWELRSQYAGNPNLTKIAEANYNTAKKRMKEGKGIVKKENIRVLWWSVPLAFTSIYPWMEEKYGAVTLTNYLTKFPKHVIDTSDRTKMLEGIGLMDLYNGMSRQAHGKIDYITDELYEAVETYSPNCLMFIKHAGCRHGSAISRLLKDTCKIIGLPFLFISADIFDDRECSENEVKEQIDLFFKSNGWA